MLFKTIIEIETEASNKDEAIDIAGEYLSGRLVSGIKMKYRTRPVKRFKKSVIGFCVVAVLSAAVLLLNAIHMKPSSGIAAINPAAFAMQPPLRTAVNDGKKHANFKKKWMDLQTRQALNRIKQ